MAGAPPVQFGANCRFHDSPSGPQLWTFAFVLLLLRIVLILIYVFQQLTVAEYFRDEEGQDGE